MLELSLEQKKIIELCLKSYSDSVVVTDFLTHSIVFCEFLLKQNQHLNLIGKNTEQDIINRHLIDSVQLVKYLPFQHKAILDIGSGSGFPGIILAIASKTNTMTLIEKSPLKAQFLQDSVNYLKLTNCNIICSTIDDWINSAFFFKPVITTSRAFKPLKELLIYQKALQSPMLTLKGKTYQQEILETKKDPRLFNISQSICDPSGVVMEF